VCASPDDELIRFAPKPVELTPLRLLINDFAGSPFQIQLSRELAQTGHTVLHTYFADNDTTPKGMTTVKADDPRGFAIEPVSFGRQFKKHSLLSRRRADIAYGKAVSDRVRVFLPDVVLSANMPLDGQKILMQASQQSNAKFIFWLQDVLSIGIEFVLRKKHVPLAMLAGKMYARMEKTLLCKSDAVVCIAPEFREMLDSDGVDARKTFVIENWAPLDEIRPMPHDTAWLREHRISGKFCFMYSGTLGMKHKPELLLELAKRFEARGDVVTVVVAQGAGADWLQNNAHVRPGSLLVVPFQPYERVSEVLGSADVLITLLDRDCGAFAVPSKTLAHLCARRPLLVAAPKSNLASKIVRRASAGEVVEPDDTQGFLSAAVALFENEPLRKMYASHARAYAERTFAITNIGQHFLEVIDFVLHGSSAAGEMGQAAASAPSPASSYRDLY